MRRLLAAFTLGFAFHGSPQTSLRGADDPRAIIYEIAAQIDAPLVAIAGNKRTPFGWSAFPITYGHSTVVQWNAGDGVSPTHPPSRLRLTVAIDERVECHVDVALAKSGRRVGTFDLRYPQALQIFELEWAPADAIAARCEGISLQLRANGPDIWCFSPNTKTDSCPPQLQPHLLTTTGPVDAKAEYFRRLASRTSVVPFGWIEGCVLDGLHDLAAGDPNSPFEAARRAHWALFLDPESRLVYEAASKPVIDHFESIEGTLPVADLALWQPNHRVVDVALNFLAKSKRPTGLIYTGGTVSAEGAYTVAYPLAAIGAARENPSSAADALRELLGRRDRLWYDGAIWLRHTDQGTRTFRNWSRGVAWYFLGLVRSLPHLRAAGVEVHEIEAEIIRTAAFVRGHQSSDGLWNCFLGDPTTAPDTSGSAGIAAALALGARAGVLSPDDLVAARRTIPALVARLTPDGFLTGVAQGNRGGERLQRSDYRVISQMGMGLMGQLLAAAQPEG